MRLRNVLIMLLLTLQTAESAAELISGKIKAWAESSHPIQIGGGGNYVTLYWSINGPDSAWFYGSSYSQNPETDIAILEHITSIEQIGNVANIEFTSQPIGGICDVDCDPDQVGDFVVFINNQTGHIGVLRVDSIHTPDGMDATWWFQTDGSTVITDTIFISDFELE